MEGHLMSTTASYIEEKPSKVKEKIAALKVLIADDNFILQSVAKRFFVRAGVPEENIVIVENGEDAVNLVRSGLCFDVIYMDELMPVMQGPEATLKIRELEKSMKLQSVIFTCSASYLGVFPGANTRLEKPLNFEKLLVFLQKVVDSTLELTEEGEHSSKENHQGISPYVRLNWFSKRSLDEDNLDEIIEKRPRL